MTESIDFTTAGSHEVADSNIPIRILSAAYGPSHERRLMHGEVVPVDESSRMPYTRDVLPFIEAYLYRPTTRQKNVQDLPQQSGYLLQGGGSWDITSVKDEVYSCKRRKTDTEWCTEVALMDGKSMNIIFGDPCPGTTKRLDITYVFTHDIQHVTDKGSSHILDQSLICHASFAEHEQVVLKRRLIPVSRFRHNDQPLQQQNEPQFRMDSTKLQSLEGSEGRSCVKNKLPKECPVRKDSIGWSSPSIPWCLRNDISEIALPLILPYLSLTQRLQCQQVCKVWKDVISEQGVAEYIDINESFDGATQTRYTHRVLRGIISNSYPSLRRLFLNNYTALSPQDFHPAIPHLRKLTQLDVSRCIQLTDDTLLLIARYLKDTLEILYMKGLRNTSDVGLIAISESCHKLCILEISNVPITDASGTAIGRHLQKLMALYMRDNYLLTNASLHAIVGGCPKLTQLTLWGCTRITNFQSDGGRTAPGNPSSTNHIISNVSSETSNLDLKIPCSNITSENIFYAARNLSVLNLWGCHGLQDDSFAFSGFHSNWNPLGCLKTLIVSECHQLTDKFILNLVQVVPHLIHLHVRYLRRITDCSINAIASSMTQLYSIDLSFCNRITSSAIEHLLCSLTLGLAEIRLFHCHQIDEWAFNHIISTLEALPQTSLSILDVRECSIGRLNSNELEAGADISKRLSTPPFCFAEPVPHFYVRPAVLSTGLREQFTTY